MQQDSDEAAAAAQSQLASLIRALKDQAKADGDNGRLAGLSREHASIWQDLVGQAIERQYIDVNMSKMIYTGLKQMKQWLHWRIL